MRKVIRQETIPARVVRVERYVAEDGQEFATEGQCLKHERDLKISAHRVYQSRIVGLRTYDDDIPMVLYHLQDGSDLEFLLNFIKPNNSLDWIQTFEKFGPGWYFHWYVDDNYCPTNHLDNLLDYLSRTRYEFDGWCRSIMTQIGQNENKE